MPEYLRIYANWINLYINYARKNGLSEEQIQKLLEIYRAPSSIDDYMFITYAHDSIEGNFEEDIKYLETIDAQF